MSQSVWGDETTQFFYQLSPDAILSAIESLDYRTTGRCMALNSMENRVYEIEIETENDETKMIIAKFYRPGRWSIEQIQEEHDFLLELSEHEIPVIAPIVHSGKTLFQVPDQSLFFCIFPKQGGRAPMDMNQEMLQILGRLLARIHNVGASKPAHHRLELNPTTYGLQNLAYLIQQKVIPNHLEKTYHDLVEEICKKSQPLFEETQIHRIHGDCHMGNVLYREDTGFFFIDFDDMVVGPAIQDIWLLVGGDDDQAIFDRNTLLDAYDSMRPFEYQSLRLIEPLRALRYIHFCAWITKRWQDPAFQAAFSYYGTDSYWATQIQDLQVQCEKIQNF